MALFDAIISHDLPIFQFLSIAVHNLLLRGYSGLHLDHLLHLGHWAGPSHLELMPLPLITRLHQNQGQLLITGLHHLQGEVDGRLLVDAIRWQSSLGLQGLRAQLEDLVLNGNLSPRPDMFIDLIHSVSRMGSEGHWSPLLRVDSHLDNKRPRDSCLDCLPSSTPFVPPPPLLPPLSAYLVLQILYNKLCPSLVWNLSLKFPGLILENQSYPFVLLSTAKCYW